MARTYFNVLAIEVTSTTAARTVLQLKAPTNQRVAIWEVSVSFKGTNAAQTPIKVEFVQQTTAGSGGVSASLTKDDPSSPDTVQSTALQALTTEPTGTAVSFAEEVNAASGGFYYGAPQDKPIQVPPNNYLGIRITADTNTTLIARLRCEE